MGRSITQRDIIGQRFGRLTVVSFGKPYIWNGKVREYYMVCRCDCGNTVEIRRSSLFNTKTGTKSCGCLHSEGLVARNYKHGLRHTNLYKRFLSMKDRCYNPNSNKYKNYGARGIKVCAEWINDFHAFYEWAMANGYKKELSIDRINVNGDYEPGNCRWATDKEQALNTRRNRFFTYNGKTLSITQWGTELGGGVALIGNRLKNGWSLERALSTPAMRKGKAV